jgi:hypothetical protein
MKRDETREQTVRLRQDIPELGLSRGQMGTLCSTWFAPRTAFEVEFEEAGIGHAVRALLLEGQFEPGVAQQQ